MKKTGRWIPLAVVLIILGIVLIIGAFAVSGFDFSKFNSSRKETNTYEIKDRFQNIAIDVRTTDVTFVLSQDGSRKVVCQEEEKVRHNVTVENGTLTIGIADTRSWFDYLGFHMADMNVTVYLPKQEYEALTIKTNTGDVTIPAGLTFGSIGIDIDTGDVDVRAGSRGALNINTHTGDIYAEKLEAKELRLTTHTGDIRMEEIRVAETAAFETHTGKVNLKDLTCTTFEAKTDTDDVNLKDVVASGRMTIETNTGDVRFDDSDAAEIYVSTDTGDVTGTLRSEKVFLTETDTGDVDVPKSITGGRCEITTDTGDSEIAVAVATP